MKAYTYRKATSAELYDNERYTREDGKRQSKQRDLERKDGQRIKTATRRGA